MPGDGINSNMSRRAVDGVLYCFEGVEYGLSGRGAWVNGLVNVE